MDNTSYGDTVNRSYEINNFNTHLIPTSEKDAKWGYNVFFTNKHNLTCAFLSANAVGTYNLDYDLIRQYAMSNQPESIYKVMFDPQDKQAQYTGLNWNIAPCINTLRSRVLKTLSDIPSDVVCEAVDPMANSQKNMDRLRLMAQPILDKKLAMISAKMGLSRPIKSGFDKQILKKPQDAGIPDMGMNITSDDEVDIYMDREAGYYNTNVEMANELGIKALFEYNKFDSLREYLQEDAFDYGICAHRTYISTTTGMPVFQYLRPDKLFIQRSKYKDFSDTNIWYYPVPATLGDIKDYFGDELTDDDVKEIWDKSNKRMPSGMGFNPSGFTWDWRRWNYDDLTRIEVDLSYFEFKSQNTLTYEVSDTKTGNKKYKQKDFNYEPKGDKKKENYTAEVWYRGYYIQGMTRIFKWGLINDMVREKGKEQKCKSTLNVFKFADKGWTEMMIPWANMYQLNFLKLQHEIIKSKPQGINWNYDAISQPFIGSAGTITAEIIMKMFEQTGSSVYHSLDESGEPLLANANAPHQIMPNGISREARQFADYMAFALNQMSDCIGISPTAEATNPSERLGLGVQNNALQSSNNAKYLLITGMQQVIVNAAKYSSYCLQEICKNNKTTWEKIKAMVGGMNAALIESMDEIPLRDWAIKPKAVPTDEEKNLVNQLVLQAYNKPVPELEIDDVFNVIFLKNYKLAIRLFVLKKNKKAAANAKMAEQQMAMQMQQMQAQDQKDMALEKMANDTAMGVATINGKFGVIEQQIKDQADMNKKLMAELNKLGIKREEMQHEKDMVELEPKKVA